jgi:hypothetical protein
VRRLFSAAVLGLAATVLSVTPALAAPPEPVGGAGGFPLEGCGFDVQAERSGKVKHLRQSKPWVERDLHGLMRVFPNQRVTLTNPETGVSITYVIAGVLRMTPTDFGLTWRLRFTGHNLVSAPGIGILYTTGSQTFVEDWDGTTTLTKSHGKVVNVCDVLAP